MNDPLFAGINRVKDPKALTDLEKKHQPTIAAPAQVKAREPFAVTITVGQSMPHPDEGGHWIQWVELYAGEAYLARADLSATVSGTPVTFTLKLNQDTDLVARARCNLHGIWENRIPIKVE
ncbi:class II SORL domain-containing protein [bacterium]|nr:class II SORL domain-containing protein [bacterium]